MSNRKGIIVVKGGDFATGFTFGLLFQALELKIESIKYNCDDFITQGDDSNKKMILTGESPLFDELNNGEPVPHYQAYMCATGIKPGGFTIDGEMSVLLNTINEPYVKRMPPPPAPPRVRKMPPAGF